MFTPIMRLRIKRPAKVTIFFGKQYPHTKFFKIFSPRSAFFDKFRYLCIDMLQSFIKLNL